jgi:hypothetical protein
MPPLSPPRDASSIGLLKTKIPVYINVYDLHPINSYVNWCGLGAYHSGIEVYGREFTYGYHPDAYTGVFETPVRCAGGCVFQCQICVGEISLSHQQVIAILDELRPKWRGKDYRLLTRNCNNFAAEFLRLVNLPFPSYLNRLASVAHMVRCCLPRYLRDTGFQDTPAPTLEMIGSDKSTAASSSFIPFTGGSHSLRTDAHTQTRYTPKRSPSRRPSMSSSGITSSSVDNEGESVSISTTLLGSDLRSDDVDFVQIDDGDGGRGRNNLSV